MKAVALHRLGGPDVLELVELPAPRAGSGEVRVRVRAAAVNAADTAVRTGLFLTAGEEPRFPLVPGMEAAGVIDEVGPGATRWRVGDAVMALVVPQGPHGAYAEQVVVSEHAIAAVPEGSDFSAAATLPMNGLTALMALDQLNLAPGETLGVTGAAGAVGGYLVQLAVASGLRVVADASDTDAALVRELGAHHVVPRGPKVAEAMRNATGGGVDALADCAAQNEQAAPAVKDGGGMATFRYWDGQPGRGISLHTVMVSAYADAAAGLDTLREYVEEGTLTPRVAETLPPGEAATAHRRLEAGGVRGRMVLVFED
ncbi:NADP-dependent oxidoreductase [Streptomyces sp. AK02-01A]|uniref:quinone oxidoreductase family protein n=1 Tax=Streptomyces sp. AK02-01A TaxID=3028648 RepID=UPI0029A1053D|nr:NADP-dependent oxidoreductase [Streptomyces sp. AK02-01A]MDX3853762.1 NADP-dependent oxidoreductase [Streptomyces sp. AK02-01A]